MSDHSPPFRLGLVGLLLELALPVALSACVLLVLARHASRWNLKATPGLVLFGFLLVALSLVLSWRLDAFTLARRRRRQPLLNGTGRLPRTLKVALGGVAVPLATLAAANLTRLPDQRTPMAAAVEFSLSHPAATPEARLADATLRAQGPAAKVQGIRALQALGSAQALEQLLRLLRDDPSALRGDAASRALARALASFGPQARTALIQLSSAPRPEAAAPAAGHGGAGCVPSVELEELKRDVEHIADPEARAAEQARVERASEALQAILGGADPRLCPGDGGLDGFVLGTLLQMDLKEDAEALAFARAAAADQGRSEPARGLALLLIAKVGGKGDQEGLLAYLDSPSPLLQARAMQAVAELQTRLNATR